MARTRSALTLTDCLVLLCIMSVVAAFYLRVQSQSGESAYRVSCGSNLRQIGQALLLYANENKGQLPRTRYVPDTTPTQYTGWNASNPFSAEGPSANDVTACLFLLVRTQDIETRPFTCPSTRFKPWDMDGQPATRFSNFPSERHLSYSFHNLYTERNLFYMGRMPQSTFALAADMNPGGDALSRLTPQSSLRDKMSGNSLNHQRAGQNVLYPDGHVEWTQDPFCGVNGDCIYLFSGGETPWDDSHLLPVARLNPTPFPQRNWPYVLAFAGFAALIALSIIYRTRSRRAKMSRL